MGTEVHPFDIFKGGMNAGRSGYSRGKMEGERLGDFGNKNPRLITAIAGIFFFFLGLLSLKSDTDFEGKESALPLFWGLSALSWIIFYWEGRKKRKQSEVEEED